MSYDVCPHCDKRQPVAYEDYDRRKCAWCNRRLIAE